MTAITAREKNNLVKNTIDLKVLVEGIDSKIQPSVMEEFILNDEMSRLLNVPNALQDSHKKFIAELHSTHEQSVDKFIQDGGQKHISHY